ncbi:C-GCAxxG-C-C family protein [Bacteroidota bacterium]
MKRSEKALNYFFDGFNCAQSVIASFTDILNIDKEVALRMASGFGGGMGRMQETCGAVTGAFMVIGFLRGKYKEGDDEAKEITNNLIQEFSQKFTQKLGSINCKALIQHDLNTEEGRNQAEKEDVFYKKCSNFVKEAVDLLEEILNK